MTVAELLTGYRDGSLDPEEVVARAYERARTTGAPTWISLVPWSEIQARLAALRERPAELSLYGVPFAVKDNIDVASAPTTAACPAYAYVPQESAFVVSRLIEAGAIPIGKTNMDQFATGLTGTRTPHGACASVVDGRYISGGSSSGSAVAVADGSVPFALGTDTAGSGRVPAAFNGIVGMKPSPGLLSMRGVVPACRSLDCVSLLTEDVAGAARVLDVIAGFDAADPFSRELPARPIDAAPRIAVPYAEQMEFGGDDGARRAWERARARAGSMGWQVVEVDFAPFAQAAKLLYEGPWLAERYSAFGPFLAEHPGEVDSTVRDIVLGGRDLKAADGFAAMHRLAALRRETAETWAVADALLLPTTPTIFTPAQIAEQPVARNALLGTYTNFVNLLDLCAIAVPGGAREDGLPFGVSLIAPAGADRALLELAAEWRGELVAAPSPAPVAPETFALAVVGAHLSGEPLNGQLVALGARLVQTTTTAPGYRLYELPGSEPAKPGLVGGGPPEGAGIEVEVWELGVAAFGRFVAAVPAPLVIGTVTLADGSAVKGFLCEADALVGAREITAFGGWRNYRSSLVP